MRLSSPTHGLQNAVITLRSTTYRYNASFSVLAQRRLEAASPTPSDPAVPDEPPRQSIAILGAGITALSTAYHLLTTANPPKVTIYEKSDRIGGWLQSKYVPLPDGSGSVLFETGPRNIRPVVPLGLVTVALWEDLGLMANMIVTPKSSVAAKKRWLYYPDRLVELPSPSRGFLRNVWSLLTEPVFKGYLKDVAYEMSRPRRPSSLKDESVGEFISRRVNRNLADKVASAVLHGIYAGDAWQLSARSVLSDAWWSERHSGSVFKGMMDLGKEGWMRKRNADILAYITQAKRPGDDMIMKVANASTVTLDGGLQMFADRLTVVLKQIGKVEFKTNTAVEAVTLKKETDKVEVRTAEGQEAESYDQVISTLPGRTLSRLTMNEEYPDSLSSLAKAPSVNVNVVNLYYKDSNLLPIEGFGYLIPQATPFENNPELALGVVFDSDVVPFGQDRLEIQDTSKAESKSGTKLTVMLGGHWYNALDSMPDEATALEHAKSVVKRHLGIAVEPMASLVSQQRDAIPQYTVGHTARLKKAHFELLRRFNGRLKVAGSSFSGVGLNDCVVAGMEIAGSAAGDEKNWRGVTGLEWAHDGTDMEYVKAAPYLKDKGIGVVSLEEVVKGVKKEEGKSEGR